jgi:hypothetical protein
MSYYYDKDYLNKLREYFGALTSDLTFIDWKNIRSDKKYFDYDNCNDEILVLKHKIEWIKKWKNEQIKK